jgi:hypothetical protein
MPELPPRWCNGCHAWHYNDDNHVCIQYNGPACSTCGQPTAFYTVGAPGYGTGRFCRDGHYEHLTNHGIYTAEDVR